MKLILKTTDLCKNFKRQLAVIKVSLNILLHDGQNLEQHFIQVIKQGRKVGEQNGCI